MNRYAFVAPIALVGFCLVISSAAVQASSSRNWEGLYVGGHAGYGEIDASSKINLGFFDSVSSSKEGHLLGGIYGGYNVHLDNGFVLGGEVDLTANKLEWYGFGLAQDPSSFLLEDFELSWSGSVRARMGYAYENLLPYAAVGLAAASVERNIMSSNGSLSQSKTLTGLTFALGVDITASEDLAVRVEYRYTDYGSVNYELDAGRLGRAGLGKAEIKSSELRLGVSYMF